MGNSARGNLKKVEKIVGEGRRELAMPTRAANVPFAKQNACTEHAGEDLFFVFENVGNITGKGSADFVQDVTVIPNQLVLVILVQNLKLNPCPFGQLVACNAVSVHIFSECKANHTITLLL